MNLTFFSRLSYDMAEALDYYLDFLGAKTDEDVIRVAQITYPSSLAHYKKRIPATVETARNYLIRVERNAVKRGCPYHYGSPTAWLTNGKELADVIRMCGFSRKSFLLNFDEKSEYSRKMWDGESVLIQRKTMATVCRLTGSLPEEIATRCKIRRIKTNEKA